MTVLLIYQEVGRLTSSINRSSRTFNVEAIRLVNALQLHTRLAFHAEVDREKHVARERLTQIVGLDPLCTDCHTLCLFAHSQANRFELLAVTIGLAQALEDVLRGAD